jgi:hypothetical protein
MEIGAAANTGITRLLKSEIKMLTTVSVVCLGRGDYRKALQPRKPGYGGMVLEGG